MGDDPGRNAIQIGAKLHGPGFPLQPGYFTIRKCIFHSHRKKSEIGSLVQGPLPRQSKRLLPGGLCMVWEAVWHFTQKNSICTGWHGTENRQISTKNGGKGGQKSVNYYPGPLDICQDGHSATPLITPHRTKYWQILISGYTGHLNGRKTSISLS